MTGAGPVSKASASEPQGPNYRIECKTAENRSFANVPPTLIKMIPLFKNHALSFQISNCQRRRPFHSMAWLNFMSLRSNLLRRSSSFVTLRPGRNEIYPYLLALALFLSATRPLFPDTPYLAPGHPHG